MLIKKIFLTMVIFTFSTHALELINKTTKSIDLFGVCQEDIPGCEVAHIVRINPDEALEIPARNRFLVYVMKSVNPRTYSDQNRLDNVLCHFMIEPTISTDTIVITELKKNIIAIGEADNAISQLLIKPIN